MSQAYVLLTLKYDQEKDDRGRDIWVGVCVELGTSTFAKTLDTCRSRLEEMVTDHLNVLEEVGERARFFEEWGITLHTEQPQTYSVSGDVTADSLLQPRVFPAPALAAAAV